MLTLDVESLEVTSFETATMDEILAESYSIDAGCPPTQPRCSIPWSGCANCDPVDTGE